MSKLHINDLAIPVSTLPPRLNDDAEMASLYDRLMEESKYEWHETSVYRAIQREMHAPDGWLVITNADLYAPSAMLRMYEGAYTSPTLHEQVWMDEFAKRLGATIASQGEIGSGAALEYWARNVAWYGGINAYGHGVGIRYCRTKSVPPTYYWLLKKPYKILVDEAIDRADRPGFYASADRMKTSLERALEMHRREADMPMKGRKARHNEKSKLFASAHEELRRLWIPMKRWLEKRQVRHIESLLSTPASSGLSYGTRALAATAGGALLGAGAVGLARGWTR